MKKPENFTKKKKLRHGFKAEAERISLGLRQEMDLNDYSPLDAFQLAHYMDVSIFTPAGLGLAQTHIDNLVGSSGWSAFTLINKRDKKIIVHNNLQSIPRQQSNIMHELSHILCKHTNANSTNIYKEYNLPSYMREFDEAQEAEAIYLGGCLQIPRECLLWSIGNQNMSKKEISNYYLASTEMVTFRINSTGIKYQLKYSTIR
jgi:Zn-dependent peptidase ImmA (M78 family)